MIRVALVGLNKYLLSLSEANGKIMSVDNSKCSRSRLKTSAAYFIDRRNDAGTVLVQVLALVDFY